MGVDENEVDRTTALLKTFFNHSKNVILNHACDVKVAKFVVKHFSTDNGFPGGVNINVVKFGLQILGPSTNAHKGNFTSFLAIVFGTSTVILNRPTICKDLCK